MVIIKNKMQYERALADLEELRAAWKKILNGQEYTIGDRQLKRASLKEVRSEIEELEAAIDAYETTGSSRRRARRAIPMG